MHSFNQFTLCVDYCWYYVDLELIPKLNSATHNTVAMTDFCFWWLKGFLFYGFVDLHTIYKRSSPIAILVTRVVMWQMVMPLHFLLLLWRCHFPVLQVTIFSTFFVCYCRASKLYTPNRECISVYIVIIPWFAKHSESLNGNDFITSNLNRNFLRASYCRCG